MVKPLATPLNGKYGLSGKREPKRIDKAVDADLSETTSQS